MLIQGENLEKLKRFRGSIKLDRTEFVNSVEPALPEDYDFSAHFRKASIEITNKFGHHIGEDELVINSDPMYLLDIDPGYKDPWEFNESLHPCNHYGYSWDPLQSGFRTSKLLGGPYDGQKQEIPSSSRGRLYVELFSDPPRLDEEHGEPTPSVKGTYEVLAWDSSEKIWHAIWIPEQIES